MKNKLIKTSVFAILSVSVFAFRDSARAMENERPTEDDVLKYIIKKLPENFNPQKATLEDFHTGNQIGGYKLANVTQAENATSILERRTVQYRTRSTQKSCFYD